MIIVCAYNPVIHSVTDISSQPYATHACARAHARRTLVRLCTCACTLDLVPWSCTHAREGVLHVRVHVRMWGVGRGVGAYAAHALCTRCAHAHAGGSTTGSHRAPQGACPPPTPSRRASVSRGCPPGRVGVGGRGHPLGAGATTGRPTQPTSLLGSFGVALPASHPRHRCARTRSPGAPPPCPELLRSPSSEPSDPRGGATPGACRSPGAPAPQCVSALLLGPLWSHHRATCTCTGRASPTARTAAPSAWTCPRNAGATARSATRSSSVDPCAPRAQLPAVEPWPKPSSFRCTQLQPADLVRASERTARSALHPRSPVHRTRTDLPAAPRPC